MGGEPPPPPFGRSPSPSRGGSELSELNPATSRSQPCRPESAARHCRSHRPALAADASALFSRNLYNFLSAFWDKDAGRPVLDDEIGNAVRLTLGGKVVHERLLG